jgi:hypothetical protein
MTGSYSRMLFNSPLNGYLYAFRIGVQKYFLFLCSHIDNTIPFNVYFYISNEVALNVNLILNSLAKRATTTVPGGLSRSLQSLMLDEDLS